MLKEWTFVAVASAAIYYFAKQPQDLQLEESYDYIIVGGGTAGSVIAARLSEWPEVSVLLIESGWYPPRHSEIPGYAAFLSNTSIDWQYLTEPQKHCCKSYPNNQIPYPRGKCLGGSGMLNFMLYHRGLPDDYDSWAKQTGDASWSYEKVLPYFRKSEAIKQQELLNANQSYRGTSGPYKITWPPSTLLSELFLDSAKDAGFRVILDYNDPKDIFGFSRAQQIIYKGRRQSSYRHYLKPAMKRGNLRVITTVHVSKIIFSDTRAVGVEFINDRETMKHESVQCRKEIIVAAGAIGSAQILLKSGIGPKDELHNLKIPIVKDLPVGKHLSDHISIEMIFRSNRTIAFDMKHVESELSWAAALINYYLHKSLPLNITGNEINGHISTGLTNDPRPDVQFIVVPLLSGSVGARERLDTLPDATEGGTNAPPLFSVVLVLLRPQSAGSVRLRSTDPFDAPRIDPNYFENAKDVDVLAKGMEIALKLVGHNAFRRYDTSYVEGKAVNRTCLKEGKYLSQSYFKCVIRHRAHTTFHPVSTCRMGLTNADSVLDSKLRVRGIAGLRVIDASAFPSQISGNTNMPVVMLAEKGSDLVLEELDKVRES